MNDRYTCGDCEWFRVFFSKGQDYAVHGKCHLNPPVPVVLDGKIKSLRPVVGQDDMPCEAFSEARR